MLFLFNFFVIFETLPFLCRLLNDQQLKKAPFA